MAEVNNRAYTKERNTWRARVRFDGNGLKFEKGYWFTAHPISLWILLFCLECGVNETLTKRVTPSAREASISRFIEFARRTSIHRQQAFVRLCSVRFEIYLYTEPIKSIDVS